MINGEDLLNAWAQHLKENPLRFNHEDKVNGIRKHVKFLRVLETLFTSLREALRYIQGIRSLPPYEEALLKALKESHFYMLKHHAVLYLMQNTMAILQKEESDFFNSILDMKEDELKYFSSEQVRTLLNLWKRLYGENDIEFNRLGNYAWELIGLEKLIGVIRNFLESSDEEELRHIGERLPNVRAFSLHPIFQHIFARDDNSPLLSLLREL